MYHRTRKNLTGLKASYLAAGCLAVLGCGEALAQTAAVFATGLQNPSKIILGPAGTLLVTEAGSTPNSGRVSLVDTSGVRRTLLDALPSGLAAPDMSVDGPNGLVLSGRTLFVANGEGDSFRNGAKPGQIIPNPTGPSSPLFATILQFAFSTDVDKLGSGFTLTAAQQNTLADGKPVVLTNSANDTATVQSVTAFRVDRPDPISIYRNTHLYGLLMSSTQAGQLYVVDAGNNAIWQVDTVTGRTKLLTRFAPTPNPLAPVGPPVSEAVPTSITAYGDQLLVSLLSGAPFVPGASRIVLVDPATGNATTFIAVLSSAIDIQFRIKQDGSGQWFVLEYSNALTANPPGPGRLLAYTNPVGQILMSNLKGPTSMVLDGSAGTLYLTSRSDGTIVKVNVGQ